jgi:hypothetical protein
MLLVLDEECMLFTHMVFGSLLLDWEALYDYATHVRFEMGEQTDLSSGLTWKFAVT